MGGFYSEILAFIRGDLPKSLDGLLDWPEDHRLLAAYYAKALGLDPLESVLYLTRAVNPQSRAVSCVPVYKNTGSTRNYRCVVCHTITGSFCPKWRRTVRSSQEVDEHLDYELRRITQLMRLLGDVKPKLAMLRCFVGIT
jgi:hypothetical protein